MPEMPDGSVCLALGEYPLNTIVAHHSTPDIKWKIVSQKMGDDGEVETVMLQRMGGQLNRSSAEKLASCSDYFADPGRNLSRRLSRAIQAASEKKAAAESTDGPEKKATKPSSKRTTKSAGSDKQKPPVKRRAPATTKPRSPRSKGGSQVRGEPTIPISEVKLDPWNPFEYSGRMHGYFQAFLDGSGKATYGELMASCMSLAEQFGISDTKEAIRRDLNNQTWNWLQGKWGLLVTRDDSMCEKTASGNPKKEYRDRVVFTCVEVRGVPWEEAVGRRRSG